MSRYTFGLITMSVGILLFMLGAGNSNTPIAAIGVVLAIGSIIFIIYEMLTGGDPHDAEQAKFGIGLVVFVVIIVICGVLSGLIKRIFG